MRPPRKQTRLNELDLRVTGLIINWERDPERSHMEYDELCREVLTLAADGGDVMNLARVLLLVHDHDLKWWAA